MIMHRLRTRLARTLAQTTLVTLVTVMTSGAQAGVFTLDTSSFNGENLRLEINLLDGDLSLGNNSVTAFGETVSDIGQIIHDFTATDFLSFNLNFSGNFAGGDADRLVINLLDPDTNFTRVDTDLDLLEAAVPYADALLVCDLGTPGCTVATQSDPALGVAFVPEPALSSLLLLIPGVLAFSRKATGTRAQ